MDDSAPKSVNQILRENARERLFVVPLRWSDRHLDLLGCTFEQAHLVNDDKARVFNEAYVDHETCISSHTEVETDHQRTQIMTQPPAAEGDNHPATGSGSTGTSARLESLAEAAWVLEFAGCRKRRLAAIQELLNTGDKTQLKVMYNPISFNFASRPVGRVKAMFFLRPGDGHAPQLAYLEVHDMADWRYNCYPCAHLRDLPNLRLAVKKCRALQPTDKIRDPYIVGVMIAMAQAQERRYARKIRGTLDPDADNKTYPTRLILLHPAVYLLRTVPEAIHIFTARVPARFLAKLHHPDSVPKGDARLVVHHDVVPTEPRERLIQVLQAIGKADWPDRGTDSVAGLLGKRKRAASDA